MDFVIGQLQPDTHRVHTPTMTLKNAALLAFVGTLLMTALLGVEFLSTPINVLAERGGSGAVVPSLIYAFGSLTVTVFFFVFRKDSRKFGEDGFGLFARRPSQTSILRSSGLSGTDQTGRNSAD